MLTLTSYYHTILVDGVTSTSVSATHIVVILFGITLNYYVSNIYKPPAADLNRFMSSPDYPSSDSYSDYLSTKTETVVTVDELAAAAATEQHPIDLIIGTGITVADNAEQEAAVVVVVEGEEDGQHAIAPQPPAPIIRRANAAKQPSTLLVDEDGTVHHLPSFNLRNWTGKAYLDDNQMRNERRGINEAWKQYGSSRSQP